MGKQLRFLLLFEDENVLNMYVWFIWRFNAIVQLKMKFLLLIHPHAFLNAFLFLLWNKNIISQIVQAAIFHTVKVNGDWECIKAA